MDATRRAVPRIALSTAPTSSALALTEAVTRLADRPDPVPDDVWNDAARHYDEKALSAILIEIAQINVWNRLNAATRQILTPDVSTLRSAR